MNRIARLATLAVAFSSIAAAPLYAQEESVSIGYWSSGFSLGFGAVLEEGGFLEDAGLQAEYRRFSEVTAPAQAVLSGDVDIAFGAPAAAAFNLASQGAPVRVFLVTQILEGDIVVPADSEIQSVEELEGKRIGMSRPGSSTHALVTTILTENYGIGPEAYEIVPGNEGQLAQLLQRGDLDAASLRSVTIAQLPDGEVRSLTSIVPEWKTLTENDTPPALAVALASESFLEERPEAAAAAVRAMIEAVNFGSEQPEEVAKILQTVANMDAEAAADYASIWDGVYIASLTDADIAGLKRENEIFVEAGAAEDVAPDELYVPGPFNEATAQ